MKFIFIGGSNHRQIYDIPLDIDVFCTQDGEEYNKNRYAVGTIWITVFLHSELNGFDAARLFGLIVQESLQKMIDIYSPLEESSSYTHKCTERCKCPIHKTQLLYNIKYNQHACQVISCEFAHGFNKESLDFSELRKKSNGS